MCVCECVCESDDTGMREMVGTMPVALYTCIYLELSHAKQRNL